MNSGGSYGWQVQLTAAMGRAADDPDLLLEPHRVLYYCQELIAGFRQIQAAGERLPLPSHYASQIAEIVSRGASGPLRPEIAFELYQEVLDAVESARAAVLGEELAQ